MSAGILSILCDSFPELTQNSTPEREKWRQNDVERNKKERGGTKVSQHEAEPSVSRAVVKWMSIPPGFYGGTLLNRGELGVSTILTLISDLSGRPW